jgi:FkbM family methyltransferase
MLRFKFFLGAAFLNLGKAIFLISDEFIELFNKKTFCFLYNFRSMLLFWKTRFYFSPKENKYYAIYEGSPHYFLNKKQALNAYRKSLSYRANSLLSCYQLEKIKFIENDVVIDCGANVGDLLLSFKSLNTKLKYIGFEPSPSEFSCLKKNATDMDVYNLGLWNEEGSLKFFISSDGADSSFIQPKNYKDITHVKTVRLDNLLPNNLKIKLLKIEAEGAETEVILGAEDLLKNVEFITADLGYERGINEESTLSPVINFLLKRNFELINVTNGRMVALFKNINF